MGKHAIHFFGAVTSASFQRFRNLALNAITNENATEIIVPMSSEGGNLNSGFTAYNFIRSLPVPVTCINMGTVESIAVMMYLAADTRLAVEHSRFLLHEFHWTFGDRPVDASRVAEHSASLAFDAERYAAIFEERTKPVQGGVDIRKCLNGGVHILNPEKAEEVGVTTAPAIPATEAMKMVDAHWWPDVTT